MDVSDLPDRVLHIITVKSNEEAHDGEEHDNVGGHYQATGSSLNLKCNNLNVSDQFKLNLKLKYMSLLPSVLWKMFIMASIKNQLFSAVLLCYMVSVLLCNQNTDCLSVCIL